MAGKWELSERALNALPWKSIEKSRFGQEKDWLPADKVPSELKALLESHNGKLEVYHTVLYLSKSGAISKFYGKQFYQYYHES